MVYGTSSSTVDINPQVAAGELRLIREAVLMVASSRATPRVLVAGLRYGRLLLEQAELLAEEAGVHVVPLRTADGDAVDIVVERAAVDRDAP